LANELSRERAGLVASEAAVVSSVPADPADGTTASVEHRRVGAFRDSRGRWEVMTLQVREPRADHA